MRTTRGKSGYLVALMLVGLLFSPGFGAASTADRKVRDGIWHFSKGEFAAAGKAFAEADVAAPENRTISFDRACALAAAGDIEKAQELFRESALARETNLAARSYYNLGTLAAAAGRGALGEEPVAAAPEQRQQALSLLMSAAGHYRDCLRLAADHENARHNLELIRLFIKHIAAQWEAHDREQARIEMGLLEFLAMIRQRQVALREAVQVLKEGTDSPQRRQAAQEASADQAELKDEIEPLQAKIAEQFQAAQQTQADAGSPADDPTKIGQQEQALNLLTQLAAEAGSLMLDAASKIEAGQFVDARAKQRDGLDQLNQIFMAVAPFAKVLERATQQQEQLTETPAALTGETAAGPSDDATPVDDEKRENESGDQAAIEQVKGEQAKTGQGKSEQEAAELASGDADYSELEWQQTQIGEWSRMLSLKAKSELPGVEAQLQTAETQESEVDDEEPSTIADSTRPSGTDVDPHAQLEALQKSLQKAIELAPKVEELSSAAAGRLASSDPAAALPEQQQALKLLREIAEPLRQENQQQDQEQNQPNNQENKAEPPQPSEQQQQPGDSQDQQQPEESPQQRAESTLRRARERARQHRDLTKQLQQMIGGRAGVDRDW